MHPLLPLLLLAGALLAITGCRNAADAATEAAIERASGHQVQVDRDGERLRISAVDGSTTIESGAGVALPADFPDDVFLPATYGVSSVMDIGGARLVSLESEGTLAGMFDAARTEMARHGWSQTLAMQQADSAMLGFSQAGREATYTFSRHDGGPLLVAIQVRDRAGQP